MDAQCGLHLICGIKLNLVQYAQTYFRNKNIIGIRFNIDIDPISFGQKFEISVDIR